MYNHRRGNPKKRFLWRRLLPCNENTGDAKDDNSSNDEASNALPTAKSKAACHERQQENQITSPVISPPLSEEEDSIKKPPPCTMQNIMQASKGGESSKTPSCNLIESEAERTTSLLHMPRPFLASIDSPLFRATTEWRSETSTANSKPSKKQTPCGSDDQDDVEDTEEDTRLVLSTAASVLLLMRFSVTDHALSKLSRGDGKAENKEANNNEEANNYKEMSTKADPSPVEVTSSNVVSPETKGKACITRRRVSIEDPTPGCPNRLAMPEDPNELNSLHCFVRAHLLEVFSLPPQKDKPGRVGLRCVFCSHLPRKDRSGTTMCTFYPKSLQDLYRSVMTWQRIHFRGCKHVNPKMKEEYWKHKESDQTRGKTTYWVTSAMRLGLQDINNGRNGICFMYSSPPHSAEHSRSMGGA